MERVMLQALYLPLLYLALTPGSLLSTTTPEEASINVDVAHPGAAMSPQMFGIFFEDINFAADGGLYPELVKNRSFEFLEPLAGWHDILPVTSTGLNSLK